MRRSLLVLLVHVLAARASAANEVDEAEDESLYRLPDGFLLGAGISSFQAEGAWDTDGKGVNVFDHALHQKGLHVGDTASDFYHRFKDDIALAAALKLNAFRLSISWARIFPNGNALHVNAAGVQFYHDVFDELLKHNIAPVVTIYHFDHPQALEDAFGGWLSDKMVDSFRDFADFLFKEYGGKVKHWLTLNEVNMHCNLVYGGGSPVGVFPPGKETLMGDRYRRLCIRRQILAHSAAYRVYRDRYKESQKGLVGIGILATCTRPNSAALEDIQAAEQATLLDIGTVLYPLVYGDYPEISKAQTESLPQFTDDQKELIRGTVDFAGFNVYFGLNVSAADQGLYGPPENPWIPGQSWKIATKPLSGAEYWILGSLALWMDAHFGDSVKVFIVENSQPLSGQETVHDWETRGVTNSKYLRDLVHTINKNKLKAVIGYIAWSFLDQVEFNFGEVFTGIVHVDVAGGTLARTLRESAQIYNMTMSTRIVPLVEPADPGRGRSARRRTLQRRSLS